MSKSRNKTYHAGKVYSWRVPENYYEAMHGIAEKAEVSVNAVLRSILYQYFSHNYGDHHGLVQIKERRVKSAK